MSLTILEVIENAEYNLKNPVVNMQREMGLRQLSNAICLLNGGKNPYDKFDEEELDKMRGVK